MKINNTQLGRGYLFRASSNDRCNYDCEFCHPNENEPVEILTSKEFVTIFEAVNDLFTLKTLHLTGGEPLMRKGLCDIISGCREVAGKELDIAMTTNGSILDQKIEDLTKAGLQRCNVSLHTQDDEKYKRITRSNVSVDKIKDNIRIAKELGLEVKINMVIIRGFNDHEIAKSLEYAFEQNVILRFLELVLDGPITKVFNSDSFMSHDEILERVQNTLGPFQRDYEHRGNGPTKYYKNEKGHLFGISNNQSDRYCCGCDRFRMTANGIIKACNFPIVKDMKPLLNDVQSMQTALYELAEMLNSRGNSYIGKRLHVCDYNFRWNHPEKSPYIRILKK